MLKYELKDNHILMFQKLQHSDRCNRLHVARSASIKTFRSLKYFKEYVIDLKFLCGFLFLFFIFVFVFVFVFVFCFVLFWYFVLFCFVLFLFFILFLFSFFLFCFVLLFFFVFNSICLMHFYCKLCTYMCKLIM